MSDDGDKAARAALRSRATALLDVLGYRGEEDKTQRAREDARRYRAALKSGSFPERELKWAWAGNLDRSTHDADGAPTVFGELARWWPAKTKRPPDTIVLASLAGPGKTVGAIWIACHRGGEYITAAAIGEIELSAEGVMRRLIATPVLVIDDIGDEATIGPTPARIRRIIKDRHAANRTTVITTNMPPAKFAALYGDHIIDRVESSGGYVAIRGTSRRRHGSAPDMSGINRACEIADLVTAVDATTGKLGPGDPAAVDSLQALYFVTDEQIEEATRARESWGLALSG